MSQKKYSARWKRAKRLEEKCSRDKIGALGLVHTNKQPSSLSFTDTTSTLTHQHQHEPTGGDASVEQNCAEDLLSDNSDMETDTPLRHSIAQWATEYQVKHNAVSALLGILREHGHSELPKTAKTLLNTCESVEYGLKSGMQYVYLGCKDQLLKHLKMYPQQVISELDFIDISLNIDGLPLFKSSKDTLWPVLCQLNLSPPTVFPLALCFGVSKPTNLDFLDDVVGDLRSILENGLEADNGLIRVKLRCITCDAPAKAMVKSVKLCTGYYGCDKCTQKGLWDGHRVIYPEITNLTLRTDASFRDQSQEEHHLQSVVSPFCHLPTNMVEQFPICTSVVLGSCAN